MGFCVDQEGRDDGLPAVMLMTRVEEEEESTLGA
jgi:hypothetical protein